MDQAEALTSANLAIRLGDLAAARNILIRLLRIDRDNTRAWSMLAQISETDRERERCLREILRIHPSHSWARAQLSQLQRERASDDAAASSGVSRTSND